MQQKNLPEKKKPCQKKKSQKKWQKCRTPLTQKNAEINENLRKKHFAKKKNADRKNLRKNNKTHCKTKNLQKKSPFPKKTCKTLIQTS